MIRIECCTRGRGMGVDGNIGGRGKGVFERGGVATGLMDIKSKEV